MPIEGLDALRRKLTQSIPQAVIDAARDEIGVQAQAIVDAMRRAVPKDQLLLMRSIDWTFDDAPEGSITIGTVGDREYGTIRAIIYAGDATTMVTNSRGIAFQNALLQEFGTRNGVPATGYFFGTYRTSKRRARSAITRKITAAIKRAYADG